MKKTLLIFLFVFSLPIYSQETDSIRYFLISSKGDNFLFEGDDYNSAIIDTIHPKEIIATSGYNEDGLYLKSYRKGNEGYVFANYFDIKPSDENYLKEDKKHNYSRESIAKDASYYLFQEWAKERLVELRSELSVYEKYKKLGLVILSKDYAYAEYGSQFGLKLSFYNGYKKDVKYIDITVRPYNRVGDKTYDDLGRDVARVKVIGPLESDTSSSVEFDSMFWDDRDVISYLVITYMKVTFMDGSTVEIKDIKKHLGADVYNGKGE